MGQFHNKKNIEDVNAASMNSSVVSVDIHDSNDAKTTLLSRNITVSGRRTSVRLEPEMWASLYDIAKREKCSIHDICTLISMRKKENTSLTAAIRVFLMLYFRAAATEEGHKLAGHGNFEFMKRRAGVKDEGKGTRGCIAADVHSPTVHVVASKETLKKDKSYAVTGYMRQG